MMHIAVINEVSACTRNADILRALSGVDAQVYNVGMTDPDQQPSLTYIHTGLMAALLLNTGAVDRVVGGCGTGQGFLNSVLLYPGVVAGLVADPLDGWLFSRINGGNCVSLPLNKGYGWAADVQLGFVMEKLFSGGDGQGYPPQRSDSQAQSRKLLAHLSGLTHRDMADIVADLPQDVLRPVLETPAFAQLLRERGKPGKLLTALLGMMEAY